MVNAKLKETCVRSLEEEKRREMQEIKKRKKTSARGAKVGLSPGAPRGAPEARLLIGFAS